MPWKNGKGTTTQICIEPTTASIEKNDFLYRLSSAPVDKDGDFSVFPGKNRMLTPIKGAGFSLNGDVYEKFEVAQFSGDEKTHCELLKGALVDFGVIYDPKKVKAQARILNLKTDLSFSLNPQQEYFFIILEGTLKYDDKIISELETLHYKNETNCQLQVVKNVVLFFLSLDILI